MLSSVQTFFPSYQFWDRNHSPESSEYVFRDPGFALFKGWDSGFLRKVGARFGIESMCGMWDPKNNHRDLRDFARIWVGMTGLKNHIEDSQPLVPKLTSDQ